MSNIPEIELQFEKIAISVGPRKLAAGWSIDLEQDLENMHGIDISAEPARWPEIQLIDSKKWDNSSHRPTAKTVGIYYDNTCINVIRENKKKVDYTLTMREFTEKFFVNLL